MNPRLVKRNCILGGALGDALGSPHELATYNGEYTGNLYLETKINNRYYGVITLPVGAVTDDTQMTMVLLRSLKKNQGLDMDSLILDYMEWADRRPESLGNNTRSLFRSVKTKDKCRTYRTRRSKVSPNNQGDGTMMRCSAIAVYYTGKDIGRQDLEELIESEVKVTNSHNNNILASMLHVKLLKKSMENPDLEFARSYIKHFCEKPERHIINKRLLEGTEDFFIALGQGINLEDRDVRPNKGWVVHCVYCLSYCIMKFDNITDAINYTVSLGGDTDTNAKIVGDFFGIFGLDGQDDNIRIILECDKNRDELGDLEDLID